MVHCFTGVDLVKPSTIYYNSAEVMKGIPSKAGKTSLSPKRVGKSSTSESGSASSAPSTPAPSVKFKSPKRLGSTVSAQDAVFGDLVDTARVAALEDSLKVSN